MSQMIWCRPRAVIEKFIPNEYIAASGFFINIDMMRKYSFYIK